MIAKTLLFLLNPAVRSMENGAEVEALHTIS
jgi:hypothetical protein